MGEHWFFYGVLFRLLFFTLSLSFSVFFLFSSAFFKLSLFFSFLIFFSFFRILFLFLSLPFLFSLFSCLQSFYLSSSYKPKSPRSSLSFSLSISLSSSCKPKSLRLSPLSLSLFLSQYPKRERQKDRKRSINPTIRHARFHRCSPMRASPPLSLSLPLTNNPKTLLPT